MQLIFKRIIIWNTTAFYFVLLFELNEKILRKFVCKIYHEKFFFSSFNFLLKMYSVIESKKENNNFAS